VVVISERALTAATLADFRRDDRRDAAKVVDGACHGLGAGATQGARRAPRRRRALTARSRVANEGVT
jgi:hypothetical protein